MWSAIRMTRFILLSLTGLLDIQSKEAACVSSPSLRRLAVRADTSSRQQDETTRIIVCNTISQPIDQLILNVISLLEYSFRTVVLSLLVVLSYMRSFGKVRTDGVYSRSRSHPGWSLWRNHANGRYWPICSSGHLMASLHRRDISLSTSVATLMPQPLTNHVLPSALYMMQQ